MTQQANIVAYPQKIIVVPSTQKVTVIGATEGPTGPQGPQGPQGLPGPEGPPGSSIHGDLSGLNNDDHPQYLLKTGGTVTGQTTFSAIDGVKITGSSGGIWFDDRNGDGSKFVLYHSGNFIGFWNGSTTPFQFTDTGVGYATNWSVGTGSSENAFVGGSNYWRPQDAYGNSYFDINSGQFYVDSDTYYFRNRASTNNMTIDSSGNTYIRGWLETSGRIYPRNWIEFSEHEGLYSPLNGAHFYPNNATHGSWRVAGTRNSWQGLEFDTSNGQFSLMMTANGNNYTGVHHNGVGWKWYFISQDLYCNSYRGFNNVAGTGNASYHPSGIYSTGTNWLYGTIYTNNSAIYAGPVYDYGTRVSKEGHSHYISQWNAGIGLNYPGATVGGGSPNQIGFRWASPFVNCTVDNVIAAGCANFSDRRIKTNIVDYADGMLAVRSLRPVTYSPLDVVSFNQETGEPIIGDGAPGADLVGFIADEVQDVVPSAVRGEGIELKSIDSVQLISVIVSAIQDIDARLASLEAQGE